MNVNAANKVMGADTEILFTEHAPSLFTYLCHHTATRDDAEDLLADVFTAAMEDLNFAFLAERIQVAWLWRVARNKVVDYHRRAQARRKSSLERVGEFIDETRAANPEYLAQHLDSVAQVQKMMLRLTPLQRQIVQLRFGENLRCAEIADRLGKQEPAIRTMLSRALNLLRSVYLPAQQEGEE